MLFPKKKSNCRKREFSISHRLYTYYSQYRGDSAKSKCVHQYHSSELDILPKHLIIVGGGYIGLEFASMYAGFGSKVTLFSKQETDSCPAMILDIAKSVREVMEKKGVEIRLNVRTQSIHDTHDGVTLTYSDTSDGTPYFVDGDAILIARPQTND